MRKGKTRICSKCGKIIQPGGMGGHMQLAHGVIVKTVIKRVRETRGETPGETRETRETRGSDARDARETPGKMRNVREVSERVQRPSDYVPIRAVVETYIEPAIGTALVCEECGKRYILGYSGYLTVCDTCYGCSSESRRKWIEENINN